MNVCFIPAACATYRGNSTALTAEERILETCYDHIQYGKGDSHTERQRDRQKQTDRRIANRLFPSPAYKVKIKSAVAEGDFMTYTAIVVLVLKQKDQGEI